MLDLFKSSAESHFHMTEQDIGDFSDIKGRGMRFHTKVYEAQDIGSLSLIEMKAMAGLMRMESGVFSPTGLDGPVFSFDHIKAAGKETLFLELYDCTCSHPAFGELEEIKKRYEDLPDHDPGKHWYDEMRLPVSVFKQGHKVADKMLMLFKDYCETYFGLLKECAPCDPEEKKKCNAVFVNGLISNGGPAVDTFRKIIGEEKTGVFLRNCMFCC